MPCPGAHLIRGPWALQQGAFGRREIGTCVEFEIVARYLRVRSIGPVHKEWKLHGCCVSRGDLRYACRNRRGIRDLHRARRGRKAAHAVYGNSAYSIIDGERISPQRAGLGTEVYGRKREIDW